MSTEGAGIDRPPTKKNIDREESNLRRFRMMNMNCPIDNVPGTRYLILSKSGIYPPLIDFSHITQTRSGYFFLTCSLSNNLASSDLLVLYEPIC